MSIALNAVTLTIGQQQNVALDYATEFLLVTNKSLVDVQYTGFGVVGSDWIPAGQQIKLSRAVNSSGQIAFTAFNTENLSPLPSTVILMTSFSSGEEPIGIWPITIPNPAVVALSTGSVVNIGNPAGTLVVSGQPSSDSGTNSFPLQITNDGKIILGDTNNPAPSIELAGNPLGLLQINSSLVILPVPLIMFNNQPIQWDDNLSSQHNVINVDASNNLQISAISTGSMALRDHSGNVQIALDTTGVLIGNGAANVVSHNGSVSGTANLYVPIWTNSLKIVILTFSGYQSGSSFTFNLPGTMSFGMFLAGNYGAETITPQLNGVASTVSIITSLAASGGGSAGQNAIDKNSIGELGGSCNQLLISSNAASVGRQLVIIGV